MPTLAIDIETRCALKLGDVGVYKYAEHDSFRILLFAYAVDDQPVHLVDLTRTALPDDVLSMLTDPAVTKTAWNAQFERVCLSRLLGTVLPPEQWECTMVLAACSGLPRSLADAGRALGLSDEEAKIKDGERLIRRFSCPVKWGEDPARFRDPDELPEDWRRYCEYNIRDVEVERTIRKRLLKYAPGPAERRAYALDQRINDLGVLCDRHLAEQAVRISTEHTEALKAEAATLTRLDNPGSVNQLKGWLGLSVGDSLDKKAVEQLRRVNSDAVVDRVLAIRQDMGKTSVKKYEAMLKAACRDDRLRGMFRFCGAARTGRWSGALVQLQNLAQNHIPDLELARELVDSGSREDVSLFFGSVPQVLSELVRTALVAREGYTLVVADFSSIEARVIAWLAGETWRMRVFENGGDIYCVSASQMFHVPVEKGGLNGHLRQKGKIAELACIAEGQLVLTDHGLVPIEQVQMWMRVWDGAAWVQHGGVIDKGVREVITYEGLTATPDHLVWVEGKPEPIHFGDAASSGAHLLQAGDGRNPIRVGKSNQPGETLAENVEQLLCTYTMRRLWLGTMAVFRESAERCLAWMPILFKAARDTKVVGTSADCSKATLRKPSGPGVQKLRSTGSHVRFSWGNGSRTATDTKVRRATPNDGTGSDRQQRELFIGEPAFCVACGKQPEQAEHRAFQFRAALLALRKKRSDEETVTRYDPRRDHSGRRDSCRREAQELAHNRRTAHVYDIRDAGRHHRFTVSGVLVHNCGYGGGVGAMKSMGALDMGLHDDELQPIVTAWREASPNIVALWRDIGQAAVECVQSGEIRRAARGRVTFMRDDNVLEVRLPSGRKIRYWQPQVTLDRFGNETLAYAGTEAGKWGRVDTFGGKLTENVVQSIARDCLRDAMLAVWQLYPTIQMHIHDEMVLEVPKDEADTALARVLDIMARPVPWADGLKLGGAGYITDFYRKD